MFNLVLGNIIKIITVHEGNIGFVRSKENQKTE